MDLEGASKAAVFLLSLDEQQALKVIEELDEHELRLLKEAVESLSPVSQENLEEVFVQFTQDFKRGFAPTKRQGRRYLQDLVLRARGEDQAVRIFGAPGKPPARLLPEGEVPRPLASLSEVDPDMLRMAIAEEHPQVAAAVLAHLSPPLSALVLENLPTVQQTDILRRIAALRTILPDAFADAEYGLGGLELAEVPREGVVDGVALAATILNEMASSVVSEVLGRIAESHPDEAVKLQRAMFSFEHLIEADKRGLQQLLREVQSDTLLIAFKTASEPLKQMFLSCMSRRAAAMLMEELEMMPPARLTDVENAQQQIVELAMRLVSEGKLIIKGHGEEMI